VNAPFPPHVIAFALRVTAQKYVGMRERALALLLAEFGPAGLEHDAAYYLIKALTDSDGAERRSRLASLLYPDPLLSFSNEESQ
jgi:hypothetical protein